MLRLMVEVKSVLKFSMRNVDFLLMLLNRELSKAKTLKLQKDLGFMIRSFEEYKDHWWKQ